MKNIIKLFGAVALIMVGVLLIGVAHDLIFGHDIIEVVIEPAMVNITPSYDETIDGWAETANMLGVHPDSMTTRQYAMPTHAD